MQDRKPTMWQMIWMGVALIGIMGIILGKQHQIITVLIGTLMLIVAEKDDNNQLKSR